MDEFVRHLARWGSHAADLTHAQVLEAMLEFYRDRRVSDVVEARGDMLLFEWGTFNWGNGRQFQIDISRHLQVGPREDDQWQLRFSHFFEPAKELRSLKKGDRWCETPANLTEFEAFIRANPAHVALRDRKADEIEFYYDVAG